MNPIDLNGLGTGSFQAQSPTSDQILGKDDFLKLLVTQLSFQDPLNPMEATDFSAQLAQFSSLEQLRNIDTTLQSGLQADMLLATSINNTMAATVIGKDIKAYGNQIYFNGSADSSIQFDLGADAQNVTVEIMDENGKVLRTVNLNGLKAGENSHVWDGQDDNGNTVAEGVYQVRVSAKNQESQDINVTTFSSGTVTGLRYSSAGPVLLIGEIEIGLANVLEIFQNNQGINKRGK